MWSIRPRPWWPPRTLRARTMSRSSVSPAAATGSPSSNSISTHPGSPGARRGLVVQAYASSVGSTAGASSGPPSRLDGGAPGAPPPHGPPPQVLVDAVDPPPRHGEREPAGEGVVDLLFPRHAPGAGGGEDLKLGVERRGPRLDPHRVVPLP